MRSERSMHLGRTCDRSFVSNQILRFRCQQCRLNLINRPLKPANYYQQRAKIRGNRRNLIPISGHYTDDDFTAEQSIADGVYLLRGFSQRENIDQLSEDRTLARLAENPESL